MTNYVCPIIKRVGIVELNEVDPNGYEVSRTCFGGKCVNYKQKVESFSKGRGSKAGRIGTVARFPKI